MNAIDSQARPARSVFTDGVTMLEFNADQLLAMRVESDWIVVTLSDEAFERTFPNASPERFDFPGGGYFVRRKAHFAGVDFLADSWSYGHE